MKKDTELAAISADLDDLHTEACSVAMRSEGSLIADAEELRDDVASIRDRLRAVLARPAAGRDLTAQSPADEDERAVVEMEHRDRRDRAVRSVAARLRAIRGAYNAEADTIAVRHVLRAESDPPVWQSVRQLSEAIVDYSIRPPFAAAPADDTAGQGWGDVESADFIERARAATAVGSFTAQFDHSTPVRIATLNSEFDRLRDRVAELEAAGNALAEEASWILLDSRYEMLDEEVRNWRRVSKADES